MSNYQLVLTTHAVNQEAANYQHTDTKTSVGTKTGDKKSRKGSVSYPLCPFQIFCLVLKIRYLIFFKYIQTYTIYLLS